MYIHRFTYNFTCTYILDEDDDLRCVVLSPGDVLYHPAGNYIHVYACM
jgi:hypothetical protein